MRVVRHPRAVLPGAGGRCRPSAASRKRTRWRSSDAKVLAALARARATRRLASAPYRPEPAPSRARAAASAAATVSPRRGQGQDVRGLRADRPGPAEQQHRSCSSTEDLQWLDQTSEELLAELARDRRGHAACCSSPRLAQATRPSWSAQANATQVALGPLSAAESRRLVESVLGERPPAEALITRDRRARRTATRSSSKSWPGRCASSPRRPRTWRCRPRCTTCSPRASTGLSDSDRRSSNSPPCIGPRRECRPAAGSLRGPRRERVRASLGRLQAADFLAGGSASAWTPEYSFKHTLTHDVAYKRRARSRACGRPCTRRVAGAIQKLAPGDGRAEAGEDWRATTRRPGAGRSDVASGIARGPARHPALRPRRCASCTLAQCAGAARRGSRKARSGAAQEVRCPARASPAALATTLGFGAPGAGADARAGSAPSPASSPMPPRSSPCAGRLWRFHFARADFRAGGEPLARQLLALARRATTIRWGRVGAHVATGIDKF